MCWPFKENHDDREQQRDAYDPDNELYKFALTSRASDSHDS